MLCRVGHQVTGSAKVRGSRPEKPILLRKRRELRSGYPVTLRKRRELRPGYPVTFESAHDVP